jgi:hypothetical protein
MIDGFLNLPQRSAAVVKASTRYCLRIIAEPINHDGA